MIFIEQLYLKNGGTVMILKVVSHKFKHARSSKCLLLRTHTEQWSFEIALNAILIV